MTRLHVKQNENKEQNQSVSQSICAGCEDEPALPGDRYGRACRRAALKKYRDARRAYARDLAARLKISPEEPTKRAEEYGKKKEDTSGAT